MLFPKFMPFLAVTEKELGTGPEHMDQVCAPMHILLWTCHRLWLRVWKHVWKEKMICVWCGCVLLILLWKRICKVLPVLCSLSTCFLILPTACMQNITYISIFLDSSFIQRQTHESAGVSFLVFNVIFHGTALTPGLIWKHRREMF